MFHLLIFPKFPKASGEAETNGWGAARGEAAGAAGAAGAGAGAVGAESQSAGGAEGTGSSWFSTVNKQSAKILQHSTLRTSNIHYKVWSEAHSIDQHSSQKMVLDCSAAKASSVSAAGEVSSEAYSCAGAKPCR